MSGSRQFLRTGRSETADVQTLLQTIFVAELVAPSRCLWLVSAWIRNIVVVDASAGTFRALDSGWGRRKIRLTDALGVLLGRGTHVVVAAKPTPDNVQVLDEMRLALGQLGSLDIVQSDELHAKGILGDDYFLSGSMNLTYAGVGFNTELVGLETDPAKIEPLRMSFHSEYGGTL